MRKRYQISKMYFFWELNQLHLFLSHIHVPEYTVKSRLCTHHILVLGEVGSNYKAPGEQCLESGVLLRGPTAVWQRKNGNSLGTSPHYLVRWWSWTGDLLVAIPQTELPAISITWAVGLCCVLFHTVLSIYCEAAGICLLAISLHFPTELLLQYQHPPAICFKRPHLSINVCFSN